jgi:hypothetical protein
MVTGPNCNGSGGVVSEGANTCIGLLFCCSCTAAGVAGVCGGDERTSCASAGQISRKRHSNAAPHRRKGAGILPLSQIKEVRFGIFTVADQRMLLQR